MKFVKPEVFLIASTKVNNNISEYMTSIGHSNWLNNNDADSDGDLLAEYAGRLCYRSWSPYDENNKEGTNPNVKKVREGNRNYLSNILKSGHGNVLEHISATFVCKNVSRVVTHEMVRHRAGCVYSQESLRYVRLEKLNFYLPDCLQNINPDIVNDMINKLENFQKELAKICHIDNESKFSIKKKLTSAFRRFAPMGLSTNIVFTANLRALRHIITLRTSIHAEEEIRLLFSQIGDICAKEFPNCFQDMIINDNNEYIFKNEKV